MDGHSSHYQPEYVRLASNNEVVILCLPPHTSADSQPLDVGVFRSLKYHWSQVCHKWMDQHPGRIITQFQFSELLNKAWMQAMTPANAIAGFRKAGVYPFNRTAINVPSLDPAPTRNEGNETTVEEKGASSDDGAVPFTLSTPVETSSTPAASITPPVMNTTFTMEQVARYERHLEEGYDLHDPDYALWLQLEHPDAVPRDYPSWSVHEDSVSPAIPTLSVSDEFIDVVPLEPVSQLTTLPSTSSVVKLTQPPHPLPPKTEVALLSH